MAPFATPHYVRYTKSSTREPSSFTLQGSCNGASGSSKEPEPEPSESVLSEITACTPSPIVDDLSALPSPTSSPSCISNSSGPFTPCQPLHAGCCTVLLHFSRSCTIRLKCFFFVCVYFLMYYFCEKYYKPLSVQYYTADCISWVPRLTLLDLQTN